MQDSTYKLPLPIIHPENEGYWASLKSHQIRMQQCGECDRIRYPISPVCYKCFSDKYEWIPLSGEGRLTSWVIVERATGNPAWSEVVPYAVGQVELTEGPRLITNIINAEFDSLYQDMPVEIVYDDVTPEVTLAKFQPSSA
jgi:uncharacterized OB-fold protein